MASGSIDGTVKIWDIATGRLERTLRGHFGPVRFVDWTPDGQRLVSGGLDVAVRIWDTTTGEQTHKLGGLSAPVGPLAVSPDGKHVAAGQPGYVLIWEVATEKRVARWRGRVDSLAFSPDGKLLAVGEYSTLRIYDWSKGEEIRSWKAQDGEVWAVQWSPDGTRLASSSYDGTVRVSEAETGEQLLTIRPTAPAEGIGRSPDGELLAAATRGQQVEIYDATTGRRLRTHAGHRGWVTAVAWGPRTQCLASASYDGVVKMWGDSGQKQPRTLEAADGE